MYFKFLAIALASLAGFSPAGADAQSSTPNADFLFIGSYHMNNPGRDVNNIKADNVLSEKRQVEILEAARLIGRYRPTKVMVEIETDRQEEIRKRFMDSCAGSRPLRGNEMEQLGFRIACDMGLKTIYAIDRNDLGPVKDEDTRDYPKAIERNNQQKQYEQLLADGKAWRDKDQDILHRGSVTDMLRHINSDEWLKANGGAYFAIALFGTQDDPAGATWVQYWFGRNLAIFNNIVRNTSNDDRALVIYGAGHGNYLRQLATDSGIYKVHAPLNWLSAQPKPP